MYNKVFISYAKEDYETAKKIYDFLLRRGCDVWLDKEKLLPGQDWHTEIMQNLKKSDFVILLLSNISIAKRGYVQREFKLALDYCEEKLDTDIYVIPCKIDNCEVPEKLCKYQWAELKDESSFGLIYNSINTQRKKYEQIRRTETIGKLEFDLEQPPSVSINKIDNDFLRAEIIDPQEIVVAISDPAPIVILFGAVCLGKKMALIRLTRYLEENGYIVKPERTFRPSNDNYYKAICDRFDKEVDSDNAASAHGSLGFMLLKIYDRNGAPICQILDAPGEHYFDVEYNMEFPPYINGIIHAENQRVWICLVELDWRERQTRIAYAKRIAHLKHKINYKDKIILMCNKVDKHSQFFDKGLPVTKRFFEGIKTQYPHIFGHFKNANPITKSFRKYDFDFVVFSAGKFNQGVDNSMLYIESEDIYPATLWKAILKAI